MKSNFETVKKLIKLIKYALYAMVSSVVFSCTPICPEEKAFGKFTNAFSREIESEYGFETYGVGASMPVKIEGISLSFYANYPASVEQARGIVVPVTLKFIQRMNEDENLMRYLANSPASLKNIDLTIRFKESLNPLVSVMIIGTKNLVVYNKYDENRRILLDLHEETFDEAESMLRKE